MDYGLCFKMIKPNLNVHDALSFSKIKPFFFFFSFPPAGMKPFAPEWTVVVRPRVPLGKKTKLWETAKIPHRWSSCGVHRRRSISKGWRSQIKEKQWSRPHGRDDQSVEYCQVQTSEELTQYFPPSKELWLCNIYLKPLKTSTVFKKSLSLALSSWINITFCFTFFFPRMSCLRAYTPVTSI